MGHNSILLQSLVTKPDLFDPDDSDSSCLDLKATKESLAKLEIGKYHNHYKGGDELQMFKRHCLDQLFKKSNSTYSVVLICSFTLFFKYIFQVSFSFHDQYYNIQYS